MRFANITAATIGVLGPLHLVDRPESWPTLSNVDDSKYFDDSVFSIRDMWTLYADDTAGPDPKDVFQRQLGECWLAAPLKAIAARNMTAISTRLVRVNETQFVFRILVPLNDTIFVPIDVPIDASVTAVGYEKSLAIKNTSQQKPVIWQSLVEKAVAKVIGEYCIPFELPCASVRLRQAEQSKGHTLNVLDGNDPATILTMLLGTNYIDVKTDSLSDLDLVDIGKLAEIVPVTVSTFDYNICSMVPSHVLWLAGIDDDNQMMVHNPWRDTALPYTVTDFRRQVSYINMPASFRTRAGLYPEEGGSAEAYYHVCNGNPISAIWTWGSLIAFIVLQMAKIVYHTFGR